MRKIAFYIIFFFIGIHVQAQNIANIPIELIENAYSVVIDNQIDFICESKTSAVKKESIIISILNEKGKDAALFHEICDKFSTLRKFSGEIYDRTGRTIRKIKKADLQMTEYSSGLSSDDYSYFYDGSGPSYPFTVKYEWEVKYKDGLIAFPLFAPQSDFNQSVVNASYRLFFSHDVPYRYKNLQTDVKPEKKSDGKNTYEEATFRNLKALQQESYGPGFSQLAPCILFNPIHFFFDGKEGSQESWEAYGLWQNGLLKGRDQLPKEFKAKLREMTANCTSDREKVKVLYDYLAKTTRYVSIQLGIGGLQPATAESVHKTGFGDCKGLSNYMLAMLKAIGIDSYYTEISTRLSRFQKDYMSPNQTNHVILQVPLENDTLWLECTNAMLPFGYVHKDIAGHDALLIKEHGGEIYRLPSYPDSLNIQTTQAVITLTAEGKASGNVVQRSCLMQYEDTGHFSQLPLNKQKEFLYADINLNKPGIKDIHIKESKEANPQLDIEYALECEQYGNRTGNRLFIPVNPFRKKYVPREKERTHDIHINYGFMDIDTITIRIPEGYKYEALPKPVHIANKFGEFTSSTYIKDGEIKVAHKLWIKTGKYPKDSYREFVNFNKVVSSRYNDKLIVRKEQ